MRSPDPICRLFALTLGLLPLGAAASAADLPLTKWEQRATDEVATADNLTRVLVQKMDQDYTSKGVRVLRDAHPKGLGCVVAKMTVPADLPPALQVGVFQPGKSYDALVRFSSSNNQVQSDAMPDARGMAIKLVGVPGRKLLAGEEDAGTQDFIMINNNVFPAVDTADFMALTKAFFSGNILSYVFPTPDARTWRLKQAAIAAAGTSKVDASLLTQQYFSMVPYLYGDQPIKFSAKSCTIDPAARPYEPGKNFLREEMKNYLTDQTACFDFMVQFYRDGFKIEDGTDEWSELVSPFVTVARLEIKPQSFDSDAKNTYCDDLSFQPWHALAAHQPLGNINRSRKRIYEAISAYRHAHNHAPVQEPKGVEEFEQLP